MAKVPDNIVVSLPLCVVVVKSLGAICLTEHRRVSTKEKPSLSLPDLESTINAREPSYLLLISGRDRSMSPCTFRPRQTLPAFNCIPKPCQMVFPGTRRHTLLYVIPFCMGSKGYTVSRLCTSEAVCCCMGFADVRFVRSNYYISFIT